MEVHGECGAVLTLLSDSLGNVVRCDSTMPLSAATKQPLNTQRLRQQLGRLGGTPFVLGSFENRLAGDVVLPVSELNRLRRKPSASWKRNAPALRDGSSAMRRPSRSRHVTSRSCLSTRLN